MLRAADACGYHGDDQSDAEAEHQHEAKAELLQLDAEQKNCEGRRARDQAAGETEQDDLRRRDGASREALADVGGMSAGVRVVLFAEIHLIVIVLLEQHLGDVPRERDARLEGVRFRNLLGARQIPGLSSSA
jgi:hypothetical protein